MLSYDPRVNTATLFDCAAARFQHVSVAGRVNYFVISVQAANATPQMLCLRNEAQLIRLSRNRSESDSFDSKNASLVQGMSSIVNTQNNWLLNPPLFFAAQHSKCLV